MNECQCNVCKIIECLRCPKKAQPILSEGIPQAKLVFSDDCLCNICEIIECTRHPKEVKPILKEEPAKVVEKIVIIKEPCKPRPTQQPKRATPPFIEPPRVTAYAVGQPSRISVYAVSPPVRTSEPSPSRDPFRTIVYGIPKNIDYTSTVNTTSIVHTLYGVDTMELSNQKKRKFR